MTNAVYQHKDVPGTQVTLPTPFHRIYTGEDCVSICSLLSPSNLPPPGAAKGAQETAETSRAVPHHRPAPDRLSPPSPQLV